MHMQISDREFEGLINRAMDTLPQERIQRLNNVAIVFEDEPTEQQRESLKLSCNQTLFGLYEGIPLTRRGAGYNLILPDKITIFKGPITRTYASLDSLQEAIRHTLWHEIAHYYGLDHEQIHALE